MVSIENLHKRYGRLVAVQNLSLQIPEGEVFGFLGPNGAGKTTTMKILAGLARPTSGRVLVCGHDVHRSPRSAKALTGYVPDRPYVYEKLTAREFLFFAGGLYGLGGTHLDKRSAELLELFELERWAEELVESFSHGMRQRLVMAAALLHRPRVLVIDEPMVGLDPRAAELVKKLFRQLAHEQRGAVFMSTHTLEVAEQVCDRVGIIDHGRMIACGTMDELRRQAGTGEQENLMQLFLRLTEDSRNEDRARDAV
ncbi:MAG: ABC transporter ATP-binding protein [Deltaproteobacteria bacterium]|nr:MAG: ABC transporter ATP-binding protein [Deltaproteobacteria bacterium]